MKISLKDAFSPKKSTILVVGAHPDDFEIMAGGTLARWSHEGGTTYAVVMTDGELGGDPSLRRKEATRAAKLLGVKEVHFCGLPDAKIPHNLETIHIIEGKINELQPDIIITHHPSDTHQDHVNVGLSCISAARKHVGVLLGETPSTYPEGRYIGVDITDFMDLKLRALKEHRSQYARLRESLLRGLEAQAIYRGHELGVKYAEAFWVWKLLLGGKR